MVAILQATIDTLQGQLSVKDKQIEELRCKAGRGQLCALVAQQTAGRPGPCRNNSAAAY
ncbi:MAG: hypothetical protein ACLSB9_32480 [Hydrogeniiclostridium mannosilyticum]